MSPMEPDAPFYPTSDLVDAEGLSPGDHVGPYAVVRFLARGGMASIYIAKDRRTDREVAIKLLRAAGPSVENQSRFRREFRSLSKLDHPNVLHVYEWGLHGERPWYSMELLPGHDLKHEVERWEGLEPAERYIRTQGVLVQVLRALDYLHERGLVHRDLTPGNVMVQPDGAVKLTDFGVVKELGSELTGVHEIMGTAAWIAPEQVNGRAVDARADLYSLGAILYFMLTGRRPFAARTLQGWLEKHLHEIPRPPIEVDPRIPPSLNDLCVRLLEKDPADRFASAAHVLHILGDIEPVDQAEHWPPRMVGRAQVRARLRDLLGELEANRSDGAVLVQGPPGSGKSRVLDVAEAGAKRRGFNVARARSSRDDRPFGVFSRMAQGLGMTTLPEVVESAFRGEDGATRERYPVISTFKPLISALAPIVILLDDLQDIDGASLDLLEYLIRNTVEIGEEAVAFVLSEDLSPGSTSQVERRLAQVSSVHVQPLPPLGLSEVEELLLSLVPDKAAAMPLAQRLHAESEGSPAYLSDMLRTLADEGLLVREGPAWRVTLDPAEITRSSLPMPASLKQSLIERLAGLRPLARRVAEDLALARRYLPLDLLASLMGQSDEAILEAMDELVEAGIAEENRTESEDRVELAHQRFRSVLTDGIPSPEARTRHLALGESLERYYRNHTHPHNEDLAHHFERAGVAAKAYAYLVRTARGRLQASLWEEALATLDRALRMESSARPFMLLDDADRTLAEIHLGRSKCLAAMGQTADALPAAHEAARLADLVRDPDLESRVLAEIGQQLRTRGECDAARPWLERALERAGAAHNPALRTDPLYQLGAIDWTRGHLEEAEAKWRESLQTAQEVADERAIGFGFNGLGILAVCTGHTMEARRYLEQSGEVFLRLGMLAPLAIARVNLCELYHATGLLQKALTLAETTLAQAREVHYPFGTALGLTQRARALADLGRTDDALADAIAAVHLTEQLDAREDQVSAMVTKARILIELQQTDKALTTLDALTPLLEGYDSEGVAPMVRALRALTLARQGALNEAEQCMALATPEREAWPLMKVRTDLATGEAWIAMNRHGEAVSPLRRALASAEECGYRFYQLLAHHALARALQEPEMHQRHARVCSALARSLAAGMPKVDGARFLAMGWSGT